jgi:hypothetical protein
MAESASLMDILRQKRNAMSRGKKTIKPNPGRNRYRILPGWRASGDPTFFHDFGQHFIKDTANELKAVYMCVDKTYGRPCALCDQIAKGIMASGDDATTKALENAKSAGRILINVLELEGDQPDTPQVLEVGPGVFGPILALFDEWGEEMIDLEKGQDIVITREGTGLSTRYTVQVASKSKPVNPAVMKKITDLDEFVAQESEEVARRALGAVSSVAGILPSASSIPALGRPSDRPASAPAGGDWSSGSREVEVLASGDDELRALEVGKPSAASGDIDALMAELEIGS